METWQGLTEQESEMRHDFSGKVVLVTGAGGGIGRGVALALAQAGAVVVAMGRNREKIERTIALVVEWGGDGIALTLDVTATDTIAKAFDDAFAFGGKVDCAVNNAGVSEAPSRTAEIAVDDWTQVIATNLTGLWACMAAELKLMQPRGEGVIVNMASLGGVHTLPMVSAYVASKHAVIGLTRNAAVEYASRGIRINAICPGGVHTSMLDAHFKSHAELNSAAALAATAAKHPMNRLGTEDEIADAVLFLCSPEAAFITGQCLGVDGGRAIA
jgi:NAD(P)-dependent dehydrogenase (short-subunit alcohol dehydrogenase family)